MAARSSHLALVQETGGEFAGQGDVLDEAVLLGGLVCFLVGAQRLAFPVRDAGQLRGHHPLGGAEGRGLVAGPFGELLLVLADGRQGLGPFLGCHLPVAGRQRQGADEVEVQQLDLPERGPGQLGGPGPRLARLGPGATQKARLHLEEPIPAPHGAHPDGGQPGLEGLLVEVLPIERAE
jgi:hypothetical protein